MEPLEVLGVNDGGSDWERTFPIPGVRQTQLHVLASPPASLQDFEELLSLFRV